MFCLCAFKCDHCVVHFQEPSDQAIKLHSGFQWHSYEEILEKFYRRQARWWRRRSQTSALPEEPRRSPVRLPAPAKFRTKQNETGSCRKKSSSRLCRLEFSFLFYETQQTIRTTILLFGVLPFGDLPFGLFVIWSLAVRCFTFWCFANCHFYTIRSFHL